MAQGAPGQISIKFNVFFLPRRHFQRAWFHSRGGDAKRKNHISYIFIYIYIQFIIKNIFGTRNSRLLKEYKPFVKKINLLEKKYSTIDQDESSIYYYTDWPLYLYHKSEGNTIKAQQYLTDAYNHISEDERDEYLQDDKRIEHLYKYYYIHEIIEEYNQHIR